MQRAEIDQIARANDDRTGVALDDFDRVDAAAEARDDIRAEFSQRSTVAFIRRVLDLAVRRKN